MMISEIIMPMKIVKVLKNVKMIISGTFTVTNRHFHG